MTNSFQPTTPRLPSEFVPRQKETQKSLKIPRFLEAPNPLPKPQPLDIGSKIPRPSSLKPTFKAFAKSPPWAPIPGDRNHTSSGGGHKLTGDTGFFPTHKTVGASKNIKQPNFWAQNCSQNLAKMDIFPLMDGHLWKKKLYTCQDVKKDLGASFVREFKIPKSF